MSLHKYGEMEHHNMEEEKHKETLFSISVSSSHPSSLSPFSPILDVVSKETHGFIFDSLSNHAGQG